MAAAQSAATCQTRAAESSTKALIAQPAATRPAASLPALGNNVTCWYNYTNTYPYARGMNEYNMYQNLTYEATDWLQLEFTGNWNYLADEFQRGGHGAEPQQPWRAVHSCESPGQHLGFDVVPYLWRPFAGLGVMPDFISEFGETDGGTDTSSNRMKFGARFDLSETWSGYAYYSRQERKVFNRNNRDMLSLPRLQLAMMGKGGPAGNAWFNPFGSSRTPVRRCTVKA
jgi:iron complex outermembrane receptor protein